MSAKRWFLPDNPPLLDMLERQAAITMAGMDALVAWAGGDAEAGAAVRQCEHEADDQKRELWRSLRDAFSPPLDAEDLFTLSAELDEVLNSAKDLVREMEVMNLEPNDPTRDDGRVGRGSSAAPRRRLHAPRLRPRGRNRSRRRRDQEWTANRACVPRRDVGAVAA